MRRHARPSRRSDRGGRARPPCAHELDHPAPPPQTRPRAAADRRRRPGDGEVGVRRQRRDRQPALRPRLLHARRRHVRVGRHARRRAQRRRAVDRAAHPRRRGRARATSASRRPRSARATRSRSRRSSTTSRRRRRAAIDMLNTFNPFADRRDAQIIVDATDGVGPLPRPGHARRSPSAPQGGLEIIDVTDPTKPMTIGMTSHIGQAHTVNVDPKRPHIAYAVTSDTVTVTAGKRQNEVAGLGRPERPRRLRDGRHALVHELPAGHVDPGQARALPAARSSATAGRRARWPTATPTSSSSSAATSSRSIPTTASPAARGAALMMFDMAGAFDDRGTPDDFTDDEPRGTPLPCSTRDSSSGGPLKIMPPLQVVDCVVGGAQRNVRAQRARAGSQPGAPSLDGVRYLGIDPPRGRAPGHEHRPDARLPVGRGPRVQPRVRDQPLGQPAHRHRRARRRRHAAGRLVLAGAATTRWATAASTSSASTACGELGARRTPRRRGRPTRALPDGEKAIYRAPVRTGAQATVCTSHVMQQIPGQNRIFMAWYSQGTQVLDFTERPDGTVDVKEAGYFIPADTNAWVSHVFKAQENPDGTFTYWGATGDFNLGERGRNAVDVYRVTLPAPPLPADGPGRDRAAHGADAARRRGGRAAQRRAALRRDERARHDDRAQPRRAAGSLRVRAALAGGREGRRCSSSRAGRRDHRRAARRALPQPPRRLHDTAGARLPRRLLRRAVHARRCRPAATRGAARARCAACAAAGCRCRATSGATAAGWCARSSSSGRCSAGGRTAR